MKKEIFSRLKINGRSKLPSKDFKDKHKLYRSFSSCDLDENKRLKLETIKFPDISTNWSKFSKPHDIWVRENGSVKDGCYSITVEDSRFKNIATPVHDPITDSMIENYSHAEIRVLHEGESIVSEPPKGRKINSKSKKLEYRQHIQEVYKTEIKSI